MCSGGRKLKSTVSPGSAFLHRRCNSEDEGENACKVLKTCTECWLFRAQGVEINLVNWGSLFLKFDKV